MEATESTSNHQTLNHLSTSSPDSPHDFSQLWVNNAYQNPCRSIQGEPDLVGEKGSEGELSERGMNLEHGLSDMGRCDDGLLEKGGAEVVEESGGGFGRWVGGGLGGEGEIEVVDERGGDFGMRVGGGIEGLRGSGGDFGRWVGGGLGEIDRVEESGGDFGMRVGGEIEELGGSGGDFGRWVGGGLGGEGEIEVVDDREGDFGKWVSGGFREGEIKGLEDRGDDFGRRVGVEIEGLAGRGGDFGRWVGGGLGGIEVVGDRGADFVKWVGGGLNGNGEIEGLEGREGDFGRRVGGEIERLEERDDDFWRAGDGLRENEELGIEIVVLRECINDFRRMFDVESREKELLRSEIEVLKEGEIEFRRRIEVELREKEELKSEINELKEREDEFKRRVDDEEREKQKLRSEIEGLKEREDCFRRRIEDELRAKEDLRNEIEALKDKEDDFLRRIDEELRDKEGLGSEIEGLKERIEELVSESSKKLSVMERSLESFQSVKDVLARVIESLDEEKLEKLGSYIDEETELVEEPDLDEESKVFLFESKIVSKLALALESKISEYRETRKKEKRQFENSVVSLTEENRDINSLLRIALVEKEAVEKSLNRSKGGNSDQKRVALLQIAERGLQRVGFGFMMGPATNEAQVDSSGSTTGSKSDGSECEEEVDTLASTVERIMKNLRLEISQLRRSLEESRSDTERLQSLTEKQAQKITENTLYIKVLEDRETMLAQNVEELLMEIKEVEEEVGRWREACELEVEAGKQVIDERDHLTTILKEELEKTKGALEISNGKLKLKEQLAAAAMAAQAAAEKSLQLADSRASGLRERIEELNRQLEEAESRERSGRRRIRHICWPWLALKVNPTNPSTNTNTTNGVQNVRRTMLPEMQALIS